MPPFAGVQSYSFRDRGFDAMLAACRAAGASRVELWQEHLEPEGLDRDALRAWRTGAGEAAMPAVRAAGVDGGPALEVVVEHEVEGEDPVAGIRRSLAF